ncbi:unnamed protein product [Angiostrongylus costaricensis]|uniref:Uncharacterized protein n=1 Tax=Angiostrongylus costaricensis TaxID=334426 RepID=A0A0R3PUY0_ANGCS|nr:unnamed protein product [Angiostrongylus costaricensis]
MKENPTEDYELLVEGLKSCAEFVSVLQARRSDRISITTKELLEKRSKLNLDPNATRLAWLVISADCRRALQEDLQRCKQKKILEAAEKKSSLKKFRRDLCDYNVPPSALMSEDEIVKTSRHEMELIAETFYTNLFRSTIPVSGPSIPAGEKQLEILPSEV